MNNKELKNEIFDFVREKINDIFDSSVYGTFIVYWFIFHWKFIITIFFVSEEQIEKIKYGVLKTDYLAQLLWDVQHPFLSALVFILPIFFTFLSIWVFPKLFVFRAYERQKLNNREKGRIDNEINKKYLNEINTIKTIEIDNEKKQKELERGWLSEYYIFRDKTKLYDDFIFIKKSIYYYNGNIKVEDEMSFDINRKTYQFEIPLDILSYCHSNNLINIDNNRGKIELTDKGKYFMLKYNESGK
jgi:ABC-type multidrug transport system fused ATPase/permease subunit